MPVKKKFLLLAPKAYNLYELIVRNLEFLDYELIHIENDGYSFKYRSLGQRIYNFIRKTFFNDRSYKELLREEYVLARQIELLNFVEIYDYGLVIRADFFNIKLIDRVRSKTKQLFSFHFDGISRDLSILNYIPIFDQFYVFDPADVDVFSAYKLRYSPNFYLDYPDLMKRTINVNASGHVYYVSTYHISRVKDLIDIYEFLLDNFTSVEFVVIYPGASLNEVDDFIKRHMTILHTAVSFEEQLHKIVESEIIIDLVISEHRGYSFRIFEGLKFGKKVITTNQKIVESEFYHPNNFFVFDGANYSQMREFLKLPYYEFSREIIEKYSFENWLRNKID